MLKLDWDTKGQMPWATKMLLDFWSKNSEVFFYDFEEKDCVDLTKIIMRFLLYQWLIEKYFREDYFLFDTNNLFRVCKKIAGFLFISLWSICSGFESFES